MSRCDHCKRPARHPCPGERDPGRHAFCLMAAAVARGRPPTDPGLPSAARMALGIAQAAVGTILRVGSGKPATVSPEAREARLAACKEGRGLSADQVASGHCDRLTPEGRCGSMEGCGCWVEAAAKLAAKDCPLGRWPK